MHTIYKSVSGIKMRQGVVHVTFQSERQEYGAFPVLLQSTSHEKCEKCRQWKDYGKESGNPQED